jgi:endoglucanase
VRVERRLYEAQTSTTVTVRAAADSHVRDGSYATTNFGTSQTMEVKRVNAPGYSRETYLRFDLTGVGAPSSITSARLRLFGRMLNTAAPSVQVGLFAVAPEEPQWSEAGLTWNNRPVSASFPLATATVSATTGQYYEFDLTTYLRDQKTAGATAAIFALKATAVGEGWAGFTSDEASANRPELVVGQA